MCIFGAIEFLDVKQPEDKNFRLSEEEVTTVKSGMKPLSQEDRAKWSALR